jgi:hypothetical protein
MESVVVTDLYQASYLLLGGCELTGVECLPTGGALSCRIGFRGENVEALTQAWYEKKASANLWAFRSAYNEINSCVHQAKKSYEQAARRGSVR